MRADAPDVDLEVDPSGCLVFPTSHIRTTLDSESNQEETIAAIRQSLDLSSNEVYREFIMGFLLQSHGTLSSLGDDDLPNDGTVHLTPVQDLYDVYDPDAPSPGFPYHSRRLRDSFSDDSFSDLFFVRKPQPVPEPEPELDSPFVSIPRTALLSPATIDIHNRHRHHSSCWPVQEQLRTHLLKRNIEALVQSKPLEHRRLRQEYQGRQSRKKRRIDDESRYSHRLADDSETCDLPHAFREHSVYD